MKNKITLRQLLEEMTYNFYMWDYDRDKFDKEISEYVKLDYIEDFSEKALKYWEENIKWHNPNFVRISSNFITSLDWYYNWINLDWEEIDLDWFIN